MTQGSPAAYNAGRKGENEMDKPRCGRNECVKGCTYCAFLDEWEKIRQANATGKTRPYSGKEWYAVINSDGERILVQYK